MSSFFLISISLTSFVVWEMYKMLKVHAELGKQRGLLNVPAQDFAAKKKAIDQSQQDLNITLLAAWNRVFWFTAATGVLAGFVLLSAVGQNICRAMFD